jgi:hypothetical protein
MPTWTPSAGACGVKAAANRTTDAWKVTLSTSVNHREDTFELDETTSFRSVTKGMNSSVIVVKRGDPLIFRAAR